jgi:hypothetical protein
MIAAHLPTTDLYFLSSCRKLLSHWWKNGPIKRESANIFRRADRLLIIRRDRPELIEQALDWPGPLIYLIDDDIDGAAKSPGLPVDYQARLAQFAENQYNSLLRRADTIVASSDVLAERLRADSRVRGNIVRMDPFWALPFADQSHFPSLANGVLDIVHLGTASHAGGLAAIAPGVITTLDQFPDTRFTFVGSRGSHPQLESHSQVRRLDVMSWQRYRRWLPRQRFHLALYPLHQTPFDAARSANKLFEHAIVGATGVYPRDWLPANLAGDGAILASPDPAEWTETLLHTVKRRSNLACCAKAAATELARHHNTLVQRDTWASIFKLAITRDK